MLDKSDARKKPGRPRKYTPGRINATVRFTARRYAELKAAAEAEGRSISEEVEYRIMASFTENELLTLKS